MSSVRMKPIVAKTNYAGAAAEALEKALQKTGRLVKQDFESTVTTWKQKPVFFVRVDLDGITAGTDDEIYGYVNDGTKPHIIRARNAPNLRFQVGGFVPKSQPGRILSRGGRAASGAFVTTKQVMHPGTEARRFDLLISKRRQVTLVQEARHNLAIAARKGAKG